MLIASKYEEIWAPEVRDFVYISDKAYSREQILNMEKLMLNTLRFKLTVPTPWNFLSRSLKVGRSSSNEVPMQQHPALTHLCQGGQQQQWLSTIGCSCFKSDVYFPLQSLHVAVQPSAAVSVQPSDLQP